MVLQRDEIMLLGYSAIKIFHVSKYLSILESLRIPGLRLETV